jgi:Restriction endonuclease S subunits
MATLRDYIRIKHGYAFKGRNISTIDNNVVLVTPGNFSVGGGFKEDKCKYFDAEYPYDYVLKEDDLIVTMTDLSKSIDTLGYSALVPTGKNRRVYLHNQRIGLVTINSDELNKHYIYWFMRSPYYQKMIAATSTGSTVHHTSPDRILDVEIELPKLEDQNKIAAFLDNIENRIQLNNEINNNLLEQVLTLYRNRFIDTINNKRRIFRADKYFDISIGKTPPRKEPQWFSTNPQDITWVSISDMGTCGLYISSSSEQLTREAVERHNVKIVPDNTILLSFKLTVGRIAITNGEMTTNEAIAHFKTDKKEINEYLYCYLKCFNYQTMGSTSSIATAVNSKIIKGMPFVVPTDDELIDFHSVAAPIFAKIKTNQTESKNLTAVRDILLPKLMSGELDVSNIDI